MESVIGIQRHVAVAGLGDNSLTGKAEEPQRRLQKLQLACYDPK